MRIVVCLAATLLLSACYRESRPQRTAYDNRPVFDAVTTDGTYVTVEEGRNGVLRVVEPVELRGEEVAVVERDRYGRVLVTRDVTYRRRGDQDERRRREEEHR
jgi:predicted DNA-binding antitoxin AbrB/MazE fold protein